MANIHVYDARHAIVMIMSRGRVSNTRRTNRFHVQSAIMIRRKRRTLVCQVSIVIFSSSTDHRSLPSFYSLFPTARSHKYGRQAQYDDDDNEGGDYNYGGSSYYAATSSYGAHYGQRSKDDDDDESDDDYDDDDEDDDESGSDEDESNEEEDEKQVEKPNDKKK